MVPVPRPVIVGATVADAVLDVLDVVVDAVVLGVASDTDGFAATVGDGINVEFVVGVAIATLFVNSGAAAVVVIGVAAITLIALFFARPRADERRIARAAGKTETQPKVSPISAPVAAVPDDLSKKISGRKLFVFADRDRLRLMPNVLSCFAAAGAPKKLVAFGGSEHSRAMFTASYGDDALGEIVEFVCRRG